MTVEHLHIEESFCEYTMLDGTDDAIGVWWPPEEYSSVGDERSDEQEGAHGGRRADEGFEASPSGGCAADASQAHADEAECGEDDDADEEATEHGHNKELGARGELAALRYLEHAGFEILEHNWTCPAGEADIVAHDGDVLVFIEVKTRSGVSKGFPEEAVDAKKRRRYEKIAGWYLRGYDGVDTRVRFDVISILTLGPNRAFLKHYVNAFASGF